MQPAVMAEWSKWLIRFTPTLKLADPGSNPARDICNISSTATTKFRCNCVTLLKCITFFDHL